MGIKTAEEILIENETIKLLDNNVKITKVDIILAMKKYAEQFIELSYWHGISDGRTGASGKEVTQSILKIKNQIK